MGDSKNEVRWLHLSGLRLGPRGDALLMRSDFRKAFEDDLAEVHEDLGPLDYLFITGDIASQGRSRDYEVVTEVLGDLSRYIATLGSTPVLVAVPGPNDSAHWFDTSALLTFRASLPRSIGFVTEHTAGSFAFGTIAVGIVGVNSETAFEDSGRVSIVELAQPGLQEWAEERDVVLLVSHTGPTRWAGGARGVRSVLGDVPFVALAGAGEHALVTSLEVPDAVMVQGLQLASEQGGLGCGYIVGKLRGRRHDVSLSVRPRLWDSAARRFAEVRVPTKAGSRLEWRGTRWPFERDATRLDGQPAGGVQMLTAASKEGLWRATSDGRVIEVWEGETLRVSSVVTEVRSAYTSDALPARVSALAWSPDATLLAIAVGASITVVNRHFESQASLSGFLTSAAIALRFTEDGRYLGCETARGQIARWSVSNWEFESSNLYVQRDAPGSPAPTRPTTRSVTAKVVLLGEGNAGKSSLAMRLTQGRFEEMGATHAMRFWPVTVEALDAALQVPADERREVVLWDMGGQPEYRLLHRAFLRDTTAAVFAFEPRRGAVAFGELDAWTSQVQGDGVVKLLVGTKLDDDKAPRDPARAAALVERGTFSTYLETSAKAPLGIEALGKAIAGAIDWSRLGVTVRSPLYQRIRDYVTVRRETGRVVIPYLDFEDIVRQREGDAFDRRAVDQVVVDMARQGLVADLRLSEGTRMLVLEVERVEQYAGSLIIAARDNPRGVPALDSATVTSRDMTFPRLETRLPRDQEVVILEAVITMLIEYGICFRSGGMLVFPSLFRDLEGNAPPPAAVSTRFDFVGIVDNPYASLVSWLVMNGGFGPVRLWADQAEFASSSGTCGIRRAGTPLQRRRGEGRLEIFFAVETSSEIRQMFVGVIEDRLRQMDVDIVERAEVSCSCGHQFAAATVRSRLDRGETDVGCSECDQRVPLAPPVVEGDLGMKVRAFRTETEQKRSQIVSEAKADLSNARKVHAVGGPIRVLHLSDLHIGAEQDVATSLQPLLADLRDAGDGLGERIDYLVVSGDLTNIASPAEFSNARAFIETLINETGISAERCVVVPGNHDLSWNVEAYDWVAARSVAKPDPVTCVQQGKGFLVRNAGTYAQRFSAFSEHFFHPLFLRPFQLDPAQQGGATLFDEHALQFLTFNSAWHIDEWFPERSGLNPGAVSRTLMEADQAVQASRDAGRLASAARVLRLAVWHHPLTGNEKIVDDAFAENLRKADVTACLHGHVHEDRAELVGYQHPRKLYLVGAGSFGAPAKHRPESTPQLYNVLEIAPDRCAIKVHTRAKRRGPGAWAPWAVWPGGAPGERRSWYEIPL